MNWLNKLERKFGRFTIPNLTMVLIICYIVGYVVLKTVPNLLLYFILEPSLILHGQVWRVITWILIPPSGNLFTTVIMLFFYYSIGSSLERTWGSFRYNVYILSGIICTVIGAFVLYFVTNGVFIGMNFSTYYINLSIFLAFAVSYPDMEVRLYFVVPIKMKWMAIVYAVFVGYDFIRGGTDVRVVIVASLLNFIIFYLSTRNFNPYRPKEVLRKKKYKKAVREAMPRQGDGPHHRCTVCGRTELDDPKLEFRYCSKCSGNHEYCQDHLFTHEHIK